MVFTVYNRVDTVTLGYYKGAEAVGFYGAAYKVYEVLVLGAAYFANSVLPILSKRAHTDNQGFTKAFVKGYVILFFLGIFVAVMNLIFAPLAIMIIGGPKFYPSILALQILSLAVVVSYFNHLNGYSIIALNKQWFSLGLAMVALTFNLILNLILIPQFSFYGAAFNTFLTEGFIVIVSLFILRKWGNIKFGFSDVIIAFKEYTIPLSVTEYWLSNYSKCFSIVQIYKIPQQQPNKKLGLYHQKEIAHSNPYCL